MKDNRIAETIADIESGITDFISGYGIEGVEVSLEKPSDLKFGDMSSNIALRYANEVGKKPYEFAKNLRDHLIAQNLKNIKQIEIVGQGYINISFDAAFHKGLVQEIIKSSGEYGKNNSLSNTRWVIEHTSPNPNKAMHLGHLRNNLVGMSLVNVLSWNGAHVISDAVDNNRGIAITKMMWGFLEYMKKEKNTPTDLTHWISDPQKWYTPEEKGLLPDIFATQCYILGESDFKENKEVENTVRNLVVQWEADNNDVRKLWSHVLSYAYEGMKRTLDRLGNHWDKVWHEHEHYQEGKKYVHDGLKKGIFRRLEDGAVLTDLIKYNLPDTILLKNDGTSLYITQDIALTALKKETYKANKLIWVIGPEQSLAMKQLFAVCEQLGFGQLGEFTHVSYGYVGLKDANGGFKKMSSRAGTVVLIDDVIDSVKSKILARLSIKQDDQSDDDLNKCSEKLALAAVKFSILKSDRNQDLTFDADESIKTTGDSGIYVLYAYVRTQAILRKKQKDDLVPDNIDDGLELDIVKQLMFFPTVVNRAKEDLSTHHIAQYLLELCSAFNSWYSKETVLDGSERESYKLAVTKSVGIVIKNGLSILGIDTVEKI